MPTIEKKKTDKKVEKNSVMSFLTPQRGKQLDETGCKNNTHFLYSYLKKQLEGVAFDDEKMEVIANGYSIFYHGDAYKLSNKLNGGKLVTTAPDPKTTLDYVKANVIHPKKEMSPEEIQKAEAAGKLAKDFPVKAGEAPEDDSLKLTPASKKVLNVVQAIFDGMKEEVYSLGKIRQIVNDKISAEGTPRYEKLVSTVKGFMSDKMTFGEMTKAINEEVSPLIEVVRTKAPKFEGLEEIRFLNNGTLKISKTGSITGQIEVDDKPVDQICSKFEYLVNVILSRFPKAMPLIMKLAKGKEEFTSGEDSYNLLDEKTYRLKNFVPDSYESFDEKVLEETKQKERIIAFAEYLVSFKGVPTVYTLKLDTELKRGDKLRVHWNGYHCHWDGTVLATKYGVNIHYEDGYRFYLEEGQSYKIVGTASNEELSKIENTEPKKEETPVETEA